MAGFGADVLIEGEFQLSSEERLQHSLEDPGSRGTLPLTKVNNVTLGRIRYALSNMSAELESEVLAWIREVGRDSPARAVELYLELIQFSVPKLKATAIAIQDERKDPKAMSLAELQQQIVSDQ